MPESSAYLAFTLGLVAVLAITSGSQTKDCRFEFHVKPGHHLSMGLSNFTKTTGKRHKYCTVLIRADAGTRIVMDLFYEPKKHHGGAAPSGSCTSDYVHVGNDVRRLDVQLMTSYKFCAEKTKYELVSRDNEMWFVYKATTSKPKDLAIKIQAKNPVNCNTDEFTCSPVQCVTRNSVCDGTRDCHNGHDEYCLASGKDNSQLSETRPCFRCRDDTCIAPRLTRYNVDWGRPLWYLCDGYSHCDDGWDERADVCIALLKGRVGSVTQCVPSDQKFGPKRKVVMWNDVKCDGVTDCLHAEDELRCRKDGQGGSKLYANPLTIGIIAGVVVIAIIIAIIICRLQKRGRTGVRPSMESAVETLCTQCTSCDGDQRYQHRSASCCSDNAAVLLDKADATSSSGGGGDALAYAAENAAKSGMSKADIRWESKRKGKSSAGSEKLCKFADEDCDRDGHACKKKDAVKEKKDYRK